MASRQGRQGRQSRPPPPPSQRGPPSGPSCAFQPFFSSQYCYFWLKTCLAPGALPRTPLGGLYYTPRTPRSMRQFHVSLQWSPHFFEHLSRHLSFCYPELPTLRPQISGYRIPEIFPNFVLPRESSSPTGTVREKNTGHGPQKR